MTTKHNQAVMLCKKGKQILAWSTLFHHNQGLMLGTERKTYSCKWELRQSPVHPSTPSQTLVNRQTLQLCCKIAPLKLHGFTVQMSGSNRGINLSPLFFLVYYELLTVCQYRIMNELSSTTVRKNKRTNSLRSWRTGGKELPAQFLSTKCIG